MSTISDIAPLHLKFAPELYLKRKIASTLPITAWGGTTGFYTNKGCDQIPNETKHNCTVDGIETGRTTKISASEGKLVYAGRVLDPGSGFPNATCAEAQAKLSWLKCPDGVTGVRSNKEMIESLRYNFETGILAMIGGKNSKTGNSLSDAPPLADFLKTKYYIDLLLPRHQLVLLGINQANI
jgi:hypothetical protein